ncbi:MAG TPA: major capsid protein [Nitrosomonas sp.]|nr:major capsid protein [Nitrosomonas sp.]HQX14469.1 major capsid protein [Nitrosomonas sp.]HRB33106.1 major capsid protein [Nitrosomonas sp.]HRB46594.1 major capsid protein [Nitrosomonas sp.]HRB78302.1 major capsid protein [Nitrosomonas sp.]
MKNLTQSAKVAVGSVITGLMIASGSVFAALPASVTTDLVAAKADIVEVGTIVIGLAVAVAAIFWVKKPIR